MAMNADKRPLLQALRLNALFSGTSALLMFLSAGWIAAQLGLDSALPVDAVAIAVLFFAIRQYRGLRVFRHGASA